MSSDSGKDANTTQQKEGHLENLSPEDVQNKLTDDGIEMKEIVQEDFDHTSFLSNSSDKSQTLSTESADSVSETREEDFSYYEVAEDIEEYEYLPEGKVATHEVREEKIPAISLERGRNGVFDLEELLALLEDLGAEDVVSIPIPPEANFCQHMVIASAKSKRHMQAIKEEMLWIHKRKKSGEDPVLRVEGQDENRWAAMDMGNLVLHIFLGAIREYYDLESLWTLGPDADPKCQVQRQDPYALSPEDLFWLEAAQSAEQSNNLRPTGNELEENTLTSAATSSHEWLTSEAQEWSDNTSSSAAENQKDSEKKAGSAAMTSQERLVVEAEDWSEMNSPATGGQFKEQDAGWNVETESAKPPNKQR